MISFWGSYPPPTPPHGMVVRAPPSAASTFYKCQQSQGWAPWGRDPRKCCCFRRLKAAIPVTVVTFRTSSFRRISKVLAVTGMGRSSITILITVIIFGLFWAFMWSWSLRVPTVTYCPGDYNSWSKLPTCEHWRVNQELASDKAEAVYTWAYSST